MNTPAYRLLRAAIVLTALGIACLVGMTGCALVPQYEADEVHRTMSIPLVFKDGVHATGIQKVTNEDGTVDLKAEVLTHDTTIGGFERNATYKGAKLKVKPKRE